MLPARPPHSDASSLPPSHSPTLPTSKNIVRPEMGFLLHAADSSCVYVSTKCSVCECVPACVRVRFGCSLCDDTHTAAFDTARGSEEPGRGRREGGERKKATRGMKSDRVAQKHVEERCFCVFFLIMHEWWTWISCHTSIHFLWCYAQLQNHTLHVFICIVCFIECVWCCLPIGEHVQTCPCSSCEYILIFAFISVPYVCFSVLIKQKPPAARNEANVERLKTAVYPESAWYWLQKPTNTNNKQFYKLILTTKINVSLWTVWRVHFQ